MSDNNNLGEVVRGLCKSGQYREAGKVLLRSVGLVPVDDCLHDRSEPGDKYCALCGTRLKDIHHA